MPGLTTLSLVPISALNIAPKATNPDTIKLDKQIKTIKKVGVGTVGAIGGAAVYGKVKRSKKKKDKK